MRLKSLLSALLSAWLANTAVGAPMSLDFVPGSFRDLQVVDFHELENDSFRMAEPETIRSGVCTVWCPSFSELHRYRLRIERQIVRLEAEAREASSLSAQTQLAVAEVWDRHAVADTRDKGGLLHAGSTAIGTGVSEWVAGMDVVEWVSNQVEEVEDEDSLLATVSTIWKRARENRPAQMALAK